MNRALKQAFVTGLVVAGLALSGTALAGDGKGCSLQGTWYGVNNLDDLLLSGWVTTVTGQSANEGVNVLEIPTFDMTFNGVFSQAVDGTVDRGVWRRTGGNTFEYSFSSFAVDVNRELVFSARVSGNITLGEDCMSEEITTWIEIFLAGQSMFKDEPLMAFALPTHYGYRYTLD